MRLRRPKASEFWLSSSTTIRLHRSIRVLLDPGCDGLSGVETIESVNVDAIIKQKQVAEHAAVATYPLGVVISKSISRLQICFRIMQIARTPFGTVHLLMSHLLKGLFLTGYGNTGRPGASSSLRGRLIVGAQRRAGNENIELGSRDNRRVAIVASVPPPFDHAEEAIT